MIERGDEMTVVVEPREVVHAPQGAGILQSIPDGWYAVSQAAKAVGRSADTLRRWRQSGIYTPSGFMTVGESKMVVHLYSEKDLERLLELADTIKPGRKAK